MKAPPLPGARLGAFRLLVAALGVDLLLGLVRPALAAESVRISGRFLVEVLLVLPPVMLLLGLLDAWLPRAVVESRLGAGAGWAGAGLAMLLGTAAAGPIYAAFPVALSLQRKGASVRNVVVFLGTWASLKAPMLLVESSFVGLRFAMLRLAFTVPCVLAIGWTMERLLAGLAGDGARHPESRPRLLRGRGA